MNFGRVSTLCEEVKKAEYKQREVPEGGRLSTENRGEATE